MRRFQALVLLSLAACGGNVKREDLPQETVKALCSALVRCGASKGEETCKAALSTELTFDSSSSARDAAIAAGKIRYNGDRAAKCLDSYRNMSCDTGLFGDSENEDCRLAYEGLVKVGESCGSDQCVANAYCSSDVDQKCPGTCQEKVQEGGAATANVQCARGLYLSGGTCKKLGAEGAECMMFGTCASGLYCDLTAKACKKPGKSGDACDERNVCGGFLSCVQGKCAAAADVDQPCEGETSGTCKLELHCESQGTGSGVCKPAIAAGGDCTSSSDCEPGLACAGKTATVAGKCQAKAKLDGACTDSSSCESSLYCDSAAKTCKTRIAAGSACTQFDSCQDGFCTQGKCAEAGATCG